VRLPEVLRRTLEREATRNAHSMNSEIVERLQRSFHHEEEKINLVAQGILDSLDDATHSRLVEIVLRDRAEVETQMQEDEIREKGSK
jgi:hypothetical protein